MTRKQGYRSLALVVVLAGFALRLYRLGLDSLWYDETVSLLLARSDIGELIRHTAGDIHPPLYYLLLHFWGQASGWSEFSTEFLSLCFGILLIALVYRFATAIAPRSATMRDVDRAEGVALLASIVVAFSPYNVWYSQEVRMYTLGAFLGLASVYLLLEMMRSRAIRSRAFTAYVVVTVLGLYTLYYFLFLIIFEYLVVALWFARSRSRILTFAASQIVMAVLYAPWLPVAFRQATDPPVPPWRTYTPLWDMLVDSFSALTLGQSVEPIKVALILILVLAVILIAIVRSAKSDNEVHIPPGPFLAAYSFIPLLAIYALSLWKPLYHVRYIFTYSPGFYILLALGIYLLADAIAKSRPTLRPAVAGILVLAILLASGYSLYNFWFDQRYADDDLRSATNHIAEEWRPGDVVLLDAGYVYPALLYYYPGPLGNRLRLTDYEPRTNDARSAPLVLQAGSIDGSPRLGWGDPQSDFYPTTTGATVAALDRVFKAHPRVWLLRIYDTVVDPNGAVRAYLAQHGRLIDDEVYAGESNARVQGYLTQTLTTLPAEATPSKTPLDGRVEMAGSETDTTGRAGEDYGAVLYWRALQPLNYNYQLSLQVLGGDGLPIAQTDETPLGSALPTSRWAVGEIYREPVRLRLPSSLAPGDYRVIVKLYNVNTQEVLGEAVSLFKLRIDR